MSTLYFVNDFESLWAGLIHPWLLQNRRRFMVSAELRVMLVPSLSFALAIKGRMAEEKIASAGLHIWTPADARRFLGGIFPDLPPAADTETARLLLSEAARAALLTDPKCASAAAVAESPDALLRSLDRLADAGWSQEELGHDELQAIGAAFLHQLEACGYELLQRRDFEIARRLRDQEFAGHPIEQLLVVGFHAGHWPMWPVIESFIRLAADTDAAVREPRNDGLGLDATWVGSLETILGAAELLPTAAVLQEKPCYRQAEALWSGDLHPDLSKLRDVRLVVARNRRNEAALAVLHAKTYLAAHGSRRVAVLVPGNGAVAREIAAALEAEQIPFWNDLGIPNPGWFEQTAWKSFVDFLSEPNPDNFLAMVGAAGRAPEGCALSHDRIASLLRSARAETFFDDLRINTTHLQESSDARAQELGRLIAGLPTWPARATFRAFAELLQSSLGLFGWDSAAGNLWGEAPPPELAEVEVERRHFVRWIRERGDSLTRSSGNFGGHPFARLVLTTYDRADGQAWSHVVCTGMDKDGYPRPYGEGGFLGEDTIHALNEKVRRLNERSTADEPALSAMRVVDGKSLLLGPVEERWTAQQIFIGLIESARGATLLMAASDELDGQCDLRPGEFFSRLFHVLHGQPLGADLLYCLADDVPSEKFEAHAQADVLEIYLRRRDPRLPFDEYSYCFRENAPHPIRLGASDWEKVHEYPAEMWCRGALGLRFASDDDEMPWAQTIGNWAHGWLAAGGKEAGAITHRSGPHHFREAVERSARAHVERFAAARGCAVSELPTWWMAATEVARLAATKIADALDLIDWEKWPAFACETKLPPGSGFLTEGGRVNVAGIPDLLLFDRAGSGTVEELLRSGAHVWLFDFKSGKNEVLSSKRLSKGDGLQMGLYGRTLNALGAPSIGLTLLKPGMPAEQQLVLSDLMTETAIWAAVLRWQEAGRFGQLEELRNEFQRSPKFPLATLPIPFSILRKKWALTYVPVGTSND
jgi:hypothetical protein